VKQREEIGLDMRHRKLPVGDDTARLRIALIRNLRVVTFFHDDPSGAIFGVIADHRPPF